MKLQLPVQLLPPTLKKDGSATLKMETRELSAEEIMFILGCRNTEGWMLYSQNADIKEKDIPLTDAEVEGKTVSERVRDCFYVLWKKRQGKGNVASTFDTFYKEQMERFIENIKKKIDEESI